MPTILKVANVHFTQTGNNRLEYLDDGIVRITSDGIRVPTGTTAERPSGEIGIIRYNTSTGKFEGHNASGWGAIGGEVDLSAPFNQANTATTTSIAAYGQANTATTTSIAAYGQANTARTHANSSFAKANTATTTSIASYGQANTATTTSIAAFAKANNTVSASSGGVFSGAVNVASTLRSTSFGVGTAASGTVGEIRATNNITAYYSSDKKHKENIKDISDALSIVSSIGGKYFDWKDDYICNHGGEDGYFIRKSDFGVIAQDVQKVFPVAVRKRSDDTLAVDYEKLVSLAFAAIKELKDEIEKLKR